MLQFTDEKFKYLTMNMSWIKLVQFGARLLQSVMLVVVVSILDQSTPPARGFNLLSKIVKNETDPL